MKNRPKRFLATENIPHDSEPFSYICELHEYLWRVVRSVFPEASGKLSDHLDEAVEWLETPSSRVIKANKR